MTTYSLVFSIDGCLYKEGRQQGGVHICKHQSIYGAARSISVKGDLVGGWVGGGGNGQERGSTQKSHKLAPASAKAS